MTYVISLMEESIAFLQASGALPRIDELETKQGYQIARGPDDFRSKLERLGRPKLVICNLNWVNSWATYAGQNNMTQVPTVIISGAPREHALRAGVEQGLNVVHVMDATENKFADVLRVAQAFDGAEHDSRRGRVTAETFAHSIAAAPSLPRLPSSRSASYASNDRR